MDFYPIGKLRLYADFLQSVFEIVRNHYSINSFECWSALAISILAGLQAQISTICLAAKTTKFRLSKSQFQYCPVVVSL